MKRAILERNIVVLMFIMVLVTFSFADRDTKKLEKLYGHVQQGAKVYLAAVENITVSSSTGK